jgi:hypothetical protein
MHRVRDRWVQRRTALINEIRRIPAGARHHLCGAAYPSAQEPARCHRRGRPEPEPSPALAAGSQVARVEADRDRGAGDQRRD